MKKYENEIGAITVLIALGMVAMLGMTALVVDYGRVVRQDLVLTKAVDAAVLAGAQELPGSADDAIEIAKLYMEFNGFEQDDATFTVSSDNMEISGVSNQEVDNYFARFLGVDTSKVYHRGVARLENTRRVYAGVRPFGAVIDKDEEGNFLLPGVGDKVVLKTGPIEVDDEEISTTPYGPGVFGALDLDNEEGGGIPQLKDRALYGYEDSLGVGDNVLSVGATGVKKPVVDALDKEFKKDDLTYEEALTYSISNPIDSIRVWMIPIVNTMEEKKEIEVTGFAVYFIDEYYYSENSEEKTSAHIALVGRFIDIYPVEGDGDSEAPSGGLYSISLVE